MVPRLQNTSVVIRCKAFRPKVVTITQQRSYVTPYNKPNSKLSTEISKAYLERLQATIQPRLTPMLLKVRAATDTLRTLPRDPKEAIQKAGVALNKLTGYDHIEIVKKKVEQQAKAFEDSREQVQEAKKRYQEAIETRSNTQREINELLQRKHLWTGQDVTRFTELYRLEHERSQAESSAKETYQQCEKRMDREYMDLARSIMERYHEEQLWSDKIRSVSTYGTWALMVVNLLLFVVVQTVLEPYKRKRVTDKFEELLIAKVEEEKGTFRQMLDDRDQVYQSQQNSVMSAVANLEVTVQSLHPPSSPAPSPPAPQQAAESSLLAATEQTKYLESDSIVDGKGIIMYSVPGAIAGGIITAMFLWH